MKKFLPILFLLILASCKTTKSAVASTADVKPVEVKKENFLDTYYAGLNDFKSATIKASARYEDEHDTQNVTADIRIKKDHAILVSVRFLGITMAKALITPESVKYYEKINGTYFEGDYQALSQWLGTDLDFTKVQNVFLGRPLNDLREEKIKIASVDGKTTVSLKSGSLTQDLGFVGTNLSSEQIAQPSENRNLSVEYPAFDQSSPFKLPTQILIDALHPKGKTNIRINFNSASFNEEFNMPYSVPEGYERIFIK